jgi:hypothetical protein
MIRTAVIVGEIAATPWASSGGKPSAPRRRPPEAPGVDLAGSAATVLIGVDLLVG